MTWVSSEPRSNPEVTGEELTARRAARRGRPLEPMGQSVKLEVEQPRAARMLTVTSSLAPSSMRQMAM